MGGFYFPRTPLIQNGVIFSSAAGFFNFFATVSHSPTLFEETSDCGVVDIMKHWILSLVKASSKLSHRA